MGDWSTDDIPDQRGRTILITGANSGIGFEAARALVAGGAHVVLACRNPDKAADAIAEIVAGDPPGTTELLRMDLADLDSVHEAAELFLDGHDRLDVLVNNAGLMATPEQRTEQGFEVQIGVNHLGHFALTGLLVERLLDSGPSRVVTISSQGHRPGRIDVDDLTWERRRYSPWPAYFQSKLANLLFTRELQRGFEAAGAEAIAVAAHPGASQTNLGNENPGGLVGNAFTAVRRFEALVTQSAAMGALPTLRAATDPDVDGGDYFGPNGLGEQQGPPVKVGMSGRARDDAMAHALWARSEELTDIRYDALKARIAARAA